MKSQTWIDAMDLVLESMREDLMKMNDAYRKLSDQVDDARKELTDGDTDAGDAG